MWFLEDPGQYARAVLQATKVQPPCFITTGVLLKIPRASYVQIDASNVE